MRVHSLPNTSKKILCWIHSFFFFFSTTGERIGNGVLSKYVFANTLFAASHQRNNSAGAMNQQEWNKQTRSLCEKLRGESIASTQTKIYDQARKVCYHNFTLNWSLIYELIFLKVWNGAIDRKPSLIVKCKGLADVVKVRVLGSVSLKLLI